jgi:hypothetical protein
MAIEDVLRSLESDISRAISGASEEDVARILGNVKSALTAQPGPTKLTSVGGNDDKEVTPKKFRASDGKEFQSEEAMVIYEENLAEKEKEKLAKITENKSAFNILSDEFKRYGFEDPNFFNSLRGIVEDEISGPERRIRIRQLDAYKQRFGAIQRRIDKGFNAISEAEFLATEDAFAATMRQYGLPESYYTRQPGRTNPVFEKLMELNIAPPELEERLMLGQKRVMQAPPEVLDNIKRFYGDALGDGDILAFVVDPKNAIEKIKTKVTAAEIGAGASQAGLSIGRDRAEELERYGVTGDEARRDYSKIAGGLERGGQLAAIYGQEPYDQQTAETEIFDLAGSPQARQRRQKLIKQEEASFGGQTGLTGGALSRERAGSF